MGVAVHFELDGELGDHVAAVTAGTGSYAGVEDYVRDLIRRDVERERADFETLKAELRIAFAAPESEAVEIDVEQFLAEAKSRRP